LQLSKSIKADLHLSQNEIANSNIIALTATLLVRFIAGTMCDYFGPRKTFASLLFMGAIPTALAGTAKNATGLYFIRFFVGVLGGTFVPCQVWTTGFFDRNIIGTANALVGGWGNSGGGITYFVMPAIYDSLKNDQGLSSHVSWRVSFVVPFILIVAVAAGLLFFAEDTPTGQWSERVAFGASSQCTHTSVVATPGRLTDKPTMGLGSVLSDDEKKKKRPSSCPDMESGCDGFGIVDEFQHEVVVKPALEEGMKVVFSFQTAMLCAGYFCSFGGELAINSILGAYYLENLPFLGQTTSGRWAAMFGLLNVVTRPLGGFIGDLLYKTTQKNLWAKKSWMHFVGVMSGIFLLIIGKLNPHRLHEMFGLVAIIAIFLEAGNGANFALVPHIHPHANGILSGIVGATGNFGGIVFAIIFRYNKTNYAQVFWIMGIIIVLLNTVFILVKPIPSGQIGGR